MQLAERVNKIHKKGKEVTHLRLVEPQCRDYHGETDDMGGDEEAVEPGPEVRRGKDEDEIDGDEGEESVHG
jgi:hypothetical protein